MNKIKKDKYTAEDAQKLYSQDDHWFFTNYQPMLQLFGKILVQVDDKDYQGDSRVLYKLKGKNKYGILFFSWGSCSGCDSLQACRNHQDVADLMNRLYANVKRFSLDEAVKYLKSKECKQQAGYHEGETRNFIDSALHALDTIKKEA